MREEREVMGERGSSGTSRGQVHSEALWEHGLRMKIGVCGEGGQAEVSR